MKELLKIGKDSLTLGGRPFFLVSGDFHYFRTMPSGWDRRLSLMRDFGLTAVQTYVPWHLHEKEEGQFDFSGRLDLRAYLEACDRHGLKVMLRPSPYICSECDGGGLPWWLLQKKCAVRSHDPVYLECVRKYMERLSREFVPMLSTNGGPVIAVCIENEYGSYACDPAYLQAFADMLTGCGVDVPLYVTDGSSKQMLECGTPGGVWQGVNYRIESMTAIPALTKHQPDKVPYVGEYWSGRSIHWDEPFRHRDPAPIARAFREGLDLGAAMNFYMFAGGTNFGFTSGANYGGSFSPRPGSVSRYIALATSYDCDALIGEDGNPREKYYLCRRELDAFLGRPVREDRVPDLPVQKPANVTFTQGYDLLKHIRENASATVEAALPPSFEELGTGYGFVLYSTQLPPSAAGEQTLAMPSLHDRATVYLDGRYLGTVMRDRNDPPIRFAVPDGGKLEILVENTGRVCYGDHLLESCGLGMVKYGFIRLFGWTASALPFEKIADCYAAGDAEDGHPALLRGSFDAKAGTDAFLHARPLGWGFAVVNGFNIGRFRDCGPVDTLYVPGELLRDGENTLEIFTLDPAGRSEAAFTDRAILEGEVSP